MCNHGVRNNLSAFRYEILEIAEVVRKSTFQAIATSSRPSANQLGVERYRTCAACSHACSVNGRFFCWGNLSLGLCSIAGEIIVSAEQSAYRSSAALLHARAGEGSAKARLQSWDTLGSEIISGLLPCHPFLSQCPTYLYIYIDTLIFFVHRPLWRP